MKFNSASETDTWNFAYKFAQSLKIGSVVVLEGELGAGKTVFAKGVGASLGVADIITSPTFVIIKEYQGKVKFNHIDLYRLDSEGAEALGITELYSNAITLIEWASKAPSIVPKNAIRVHIGKVSDDARVISYES